MKLSIITINYNNIEGLKKTFESVICQTFTDYEWIIIDGGSSDGSLEFIKQHQDRFSYWCSEPDGGIYRALNKGTQYAHGEFVSFMNAGDAYCNKDTLLNIFSKNPSGDILYGDVIFLEEKDQRRHTYPDSLTVSWLMHYTINHQSSFTKRCIFKTFQFDPKYTCLADRKFWLQSMMKGFSFEHINEFVALYDSNGFSIKNQNKWDSELQDIIYEIIPKSMIKNLEDGWIYETHSDLKKAHHLLEKSGPCRKLLHLSIALLSYFRK